MNANWSTFNQVHGNQQNNFHSGQPGVIQQFLIIVYEMITLITFFDINQILVPIIDTVKNGFSNSTKEQVGRDQ